MTRTGPSPAKDRGRSGPWRKGRRNGVVPKADRRRRRDRLAVDPGPGRPAPAADARRSARRRLVLAGVRPTARRPSRAATRAEGTDEWITIALQDLKAMRLCFNAGYLGASAYHCQQALEKLVKFAVAKYRLLDDPGSLDHDILRGLVKKWSKEAPAQHDWSAGSVTACFTMLNELAKSSRSYAKQAGRTGTDLPPSVRDCMWAESLGVEVPNPKLAKFYAMIEPPSLRSLAKFLDSRFPRKIGNRVLRMVKGAMGAIEEGAAVVSACQACNVCIWRAFQRQYKPHAGRKRLAPETAEACLLLWLLANLDTLLKVIPHEEYGRYPGTLCGKSRTRWYVERSDDLRALLESACRAFYELYRMIKY